MFWQHVWSTLVGTAAGFIFAIALFYLTERIKRKRDRAKILKGLRRELKFDLGLHESWLKGIEDARPQVAAGDQNIFVYLDYSRFLSIFIVQAVRDGILYDLLTDDELVGLDKAMRSCNPFAEQEFFAKLTQWKAGQINNAEMFKTFEFHKFGVTTSKKAIETVISRIAAAK
ncbi:MAG: hypothetical protein DMF26_08710 [Verrucomicrobia bacterium]|nr:MAG: hypothetical protein DMF26_08710 [Verrucomicrobiota bacterium]